jgi:ATP-dependent Clp protease ATP-binding subunit ClpC
MADKIERLTDYARVVLSLAEETTVRMHHKTLGVEHILVGMTRAAGAAGTLLHGLGLEPDLVCSWFEQSYVDKPVDPSHKLELTESTKRVLERAVDEARRMSCKQVSSGHLLLGMLWQRSAIIKRTLTYLVA